MTKKLEKKIKKVLIRQIWDTRLCPLCHQAFIPNDKTVEECKKLLNKMKDEHNRKEAM